MALDFLCLFRYDVLVICCSRLLPTILPELSTAISHLLPDNSHSLVDTGSRLANSLTVYPETLSSPWLFWSRIVFGEVCG